MNANDVLELAKEVLGVAVPGVPMAINAITALSKLFQGGSEPTRADIDTLIDKIKAQSQEIQSL